MNNDAENIKAILDDLYFHKYSNEVEITELIEEEESPIHDSKEWYEDLWKIKWKIEWLKQARKLLDFSIISILRNINK